LLIAQGEDIDHQALGLTGFGQLSKIRNSNGSSECPTDKHQVFSRHGGW
jgi:hypothetical protein